MPLDTIAWAVPPGGKSYTRPAKIVEQLIEIGEVSECPRYFFHGRSRSTENEFRSGLVLPSLPKGSLGRTACFSPMYVRALMKKRIWWMDVYDDWSLAPDLRTIQRYIARIAYYILKKKSDLVPLITCNSVYMAGKLGLGASHVVPNGVDESIGRLVHRGNGARRVIVLGHFFSGRTDFKLLSDILLSGVFDEVIIGAPGKDANMRHILASLTERYGSRLVVKEWISMEEVSEVAGDRTVSLIPNVVSDYTLSQDLMKMYQMSALGIPLIMPRLLRPETINVDPHFFLGYGVDINNIKDWIDQRPSNRMNRPLFIENNSWKARALAVVSLWREINGDTRHLNRSV